MLFPIYSQNINSANTYTFANYGVIKAGNGGNGARGADGTGGSDKTDGTAPTPGTNGTDGGAAGSAGSISNSYSKKEGDRTISATITGGISLNAEGGTAGTHGNNGWGGLNLKKYEISREQKDGIGAELTTFKTWESIPGNNNNSVKVQVQVKTGSNVGDGELNEQGEKIDKGFVVNMWGDVLQFRFCHNGKNFSAYDFGKNKGNEWSDYKLTSTFVGATSSPVTFLYSIKGRIKRVSPLFYYTNDGDGGNPLGLQFYVYEQPIGAKFGTGQQTVA